MLIVDPDGGNIVSGEHSHIQGTVTFSGSGNELIVGDNVRGQYVEMLLQNTSRVYLGPYVNLGDFKAFLYDRGLLRIGRESGIGSVRFLLHEQSECSVGRECLFSEGIDVSTSDMHTMVDSNTRQRINPAANVHIGSKVWIGKDVMVLKGTTIGSNSIVGARSVVTKSLPANVAAAGVPARIIRENVDWEFNLRD